MAALETLCGMVISNCLSFICSARKQVGIGFHSPLSVRPSVVRCPVLHLLQENWDGGGGGKPFGCSFCNTTAWIVARDFVLSSCRMAEGTVQLRK